MEENNIQVRPRTGHPFGLRETVNSCIMDINTEIQF